jgi:predicted ATPase
MDKCSEPAARSVLATVLVDLEPRPAENPGKDRASLTDSDARFRLFHGVTDALRRAAAHQIVVVLIEDLHWSDAGALQLLRFAARPLAKTSCLLAATYRTAAPPTNLMLDAFIGELGGLMHFLPEFRLGGLTREETRRYVQYATGTIPDADLVHQLEDAAAGDPLFLRELTPLLSRMNRSG